MRLRIYNKVFGFLCLMVLFLQTSCFQNERPAEVLPIDSMKTLMMDLYLLEARMNMAPIPNELETTASYYKTIFAKHKVDSLQFAKSIDYYTARPEEMAQIYQELIEEMSKLETTAPESTPLVVDTSKNKAALKLDSITQSKLKNIFKTFKH